MVLFLCAHIHMCIPAYVKSEEVEMSNTKPMGSPFRRIIVILLFTGLATLACQVLQSDTPAAFQSTRAASSPQPSPTLPAVTPAPGALRDDFTSRVREDWQVHEANYTLQDGVLDIRGGATLLYQPSYQDYRIQARLRGNDFAILFRASDYVDNTYTGYNVSCNINRMGSQGECWWNARLPGLVSVETLQLPPEIQAKLFHEKAFFVVVLEVRGDRAALQIDDSLISEINLTDLSPDQATVSGRTVGIEIWIGTLDYIEITPQ